MLKYMITSMELQKAAIIECLEKGQDVILEIEMQGARQIKRSLS